MAKKHQYRASAEEKRKRKEALQRQKTKEFFQKYKLHLIIAAVVLVALIAAAVIISNVRYYAGSLQVKNDAIVGIQENWLVRNMGSYDKPKYYKMAEVNIPENYESMGSFASDDLEQNFMIRSTDETAPLSQYTVLVSKDTDAKTTAASALLNASFIQEGDLQETSLNGQTVYVTTGICEDHEYDDEGNPSNFLGYYKLITATMDASLDSCITLTFITPDYATLEEMPGQDEIIAALEPIVAGITLEEN